MKSSTNQWTKESNAVAPKFLGFVDQYTKQRGEKPKQGKALHLRTDVELQFLIQKSKQKSLIYFYHFIKERTF